METPSGDLETANKNAGSLLQLPAFLSVQVITGNQPSLALIASITASEDVAWTDNSMPSFL
jgi:hypothetical protein